MLKVYSSEMDFLNIEDKKTVHQKGLWHKVFTGILFDASCQKIYFQTIFPKENYTFERPDYMDISVGGHVEESESIIAAGLREVQEELGLKVLPDQLKFLGIRICNSNPSPTYKIREFQYFYGIKLTKGIENISFELIGEEVKSIIEVGLDDYLKLLTKNVLKIKGIEFLLDRKKSIVKTQTIINITQDRVIPDYFTDKSILEKFLTLKAVMEENL